MSTRRSPSGTSPTAGTTGSFAATSPSSSRSSEPSGRPEGSELLDDDGLVAAKLPVVPAVGDVPEGDRRVLMGQGPAEGGRIDGAEDRLRVRPGRGLESAGAHEATRGAR